MCPTPPPWANSPQASDLSRELQSAGRSVLMLDYDGTLAPFQDDRFKALPYPGVAQRLASLSSLSRVRLVLVTGRSARELRNLLHPTIPVEIWGSHGREQLTANGAYQLFDLNPAQKAALSQAGLEISALGFAEALEVKPASLAIHWRGLEPDVQQTLRSHVHSMFHHLPATDGLELLPFDGGLELRTTDRTKGSVVDHILAQEAARVPMAYLGDDLTDEDAFRAIGTRGISILVRTEVRASCAGFWLRPPAELLDFLDQWIAATGSAEAAQ